MDDGLALGILMYSAFGGGALGALLPDGAPAPAVADLWLAAQACILCLLLVGCALLFFSDAGRSLLGDSGPPRPA